ncbi:MAG: DUF1013 domain-containing protein [Rhodospirillales bacterium]|nr:DUF1013 domain-containing protein [Rhodospirillales bacterium]
MAQPLMPKATAVWLVENTALTFDQIAEFCHLHPLEVQAIADGEVGSGIQGLDPITNGVLTQEEIDRCVDNANGRLIQAKSRMPQPRAKPRGARYTPVSKRQDRPDAIAWLLKNCPELSDAQISRLIGTTKPTINSVRDKTHWNSQQIKPQNPVNLGLCSAQDLEKVVVLAKKKAAKLLAEQIAAGIVPNPGPGVSEETEGPIEGEGLDLVAGPAAAEVAAVENSDAVASPIEDQTEKPSDPS